jgi:hypothetical protein
MEIGHFEKKRETAHKAQTKAEQRNAKL